MSQTEIKPSSTASRTPSTSDVINKAATKLCHVIKRPDFDGYGFNLHSEKAKPGQFIGKVDAKSPAESAGLKEGDRIMEVNGVAINNETHKQVVQRIKAISCEVRLLLLDIDGKGDALMYNVQQSNGQSIATTKTEQVLPGASENINSITMVSMKRPSQDAQSSIEQGKSSNGMDVTAKAVNVNDDHQLMHNNNIPPPPSATVASATKKNMMNNNITRSNSSTTTSKGSHAETTAGSGYASSSGNGNATIKTGSLQLPMTAAEMRAKLMMKKKYDPKNESVDLKKKYEIVQKL